MRALLYKTIPLFIIFLSAPIYVSAATLININTADASLLETLPGIGATKASAIIDYRTQHGLFGATADIENVSGIGKSTYAEIASLITVGDTAAVSEVSTATTTGSVPSATPVVPQGSWIDMGGDVTAVLHVPYTFHAQVRNKNNAAIDDTDIYWSFGDGSMGTGTQVQKTFDYAGTYLVTATTMRGTEKIQGTVTVQVAPSSVQIDSVSSAGIMIANNAETILDLSRWRLMTDTGLFTFPEGTEIAPNTKILLSWSITRLPISFDVRLTYPNGTLAERYQPPVPAAAPSPEVQPVTENHGSYTVQTSATVAITNQRTTAHEATGALAPTTTITMAAVGAPQSPLSDQVAGALPQAEKAGVLKLISSPWSFGFLGVLAVSVGAFILL